MLNGTGNNVADYRETKEHCSRCEGQGYLQLREIIGFVAFCREQGLNGRQALRLRSTWRANGGDMPCPDCDAGLIIKKI